MKKWKDKIIIGLTGNIATGKSVVRKMLEHLGAFGIDADALGHRALMPDSPGYARVVQAFGPDIQNEAGQIERVKLARVVFSDPAALKTLEEIVHPIIYQGIDELVRQAPQAVVVLEAIKLLEGELHILCDEIWVTHAHPEIQLERLMRKRNMQDADARLRITAQPPQEMKLAVADVVIENNESMESIWNQVVSAWQERIVPALAGEALEDLIRANQPQRRGLSTRRANPNQAHEIARFINTASEGRLRPDWQDILSQFGRKTYITLRFDDKIIGLAGWMAENLVACVDEISLAPQNARQDFANALLDEAENASRAFQCEVIFVFCPPQYALRRFGWEDRGYQIRDIGQLRIQTWLDAAQKVASKDTVVFFKQLNQGRVFRD